MNDASSSSSMWYDELPGEKSWGRLWSGYIICGQCRGIRIFDGPCSVCGSPTYNIEPQVVRDEHDCEFRLPVTFMGAEGRYEDWVYLGMIEREWKRTLDREDPFLSASPLGGGPSPKAAIVVLFWSYFETRIERLFREGLREVPPGILNDALRRYSAIGTRLNDFYRVAFNSTYKNDLESAGYGQIWSHLAMVQMRRNSFAHGQPQAIDDALVTAVIQNLKIEHEAWIAVFNKRAARPPREATD